MRIAYNTLTVNNLLNNHGLSIHQKSRIYNGEKALFSNREIWGCAQILIRCTLAISITYFCLSTLYILMTENISELIFRLMNT